MRKCMRYTKRPTARSAAGLGRRTTTTTSFLTTRVDSDRPPAHAFPGSRAIDTNGFICVKIVSRTDLLVSSQGMTQANPFVSLRKTQMDPFA